MSLNLKAFSLAAGILWGAVVFLMTLLSAARGTGQHVAMLASIYPGYQVSYLGSFVGMVYAFVTAAVAGGVLAWLYNKLARQT